MPPSAMNVDWLRRYCKSLPHTTETIQWGADLVFKVGGKMYAIAALEPAAVWLSFKCTPEDFADLTQRPGVIPAPYLARASWVALEDEDALPAAEVKRLVKVSYELVLTKLRRKARATLSS
jgi:predicted DNA-binding protein (MmcQ/YjbR family)